MKTDAKCNEEHTKMGAECVVREPARNVILLR